MAFITFVGWDNFKYGPLNPTLATGGIQLGAHWTLQPGVYTRAGFEGGLVKTTPYASMGNAIYGSGRKGNDSIARGCALHIGTYATRTTFNSGYGAQTSIVRSAFSIGSEIWMTMDLSSLYQAAATLSSSYMPTNNHSAIFFWGDVKIFFKQVTWSTPNLNYILSIQNNGVEVATVAFTMNSTYLNAATPHNNWAFLKIHVKLDATTGLIEVEANGVAQSVPYTSQNTVQTTSLASATAIHFGPMVADNLGTSVIGGGIDNVYFDDAAWPSGRPLGISLNSVAGFDSVVGTFIPTGGSLYTALMTTSSSALTSGSPALRGTTLGSTVKIGAAAITPVVNLSSVVAVQMFAIGAHSRNANHQRKIELGLDIGGSQVLLGVGSIVLPYEELPPSSFVGEANAWFGEFKTKPGGGAWAVSDFTSAGNVKYYLEVK